MKVFIDDADIRNIRTLCEYYPTDGVTTNPTILFRQKEEPTSLLKTLRKECQDKEFHVQVIGKTAEDYLADAKAIADVLGKETFIKVPSTTEGYKAMKILIQEGLHVTATAVYYADQALICANLGVNYIAPYYNRICMEGRDGIEEILKMKKVLEGSQTKILAASFKKAAQVIDVAALGVEAMTLSPAVIHELLEHEKIDEVVKVFNEDFYALTGTHSSLKDIL